MALQLPIVPFTASALPSFFFANTTSATCSPSFMLYVRDAVWMMNLDPLLIRLLQRVG